MIPLKLRNEIAIDSFYRRCCIADEKCKGRIQIHHNFIYAKRQQNYLFCLLPVCEYHHEHEKAPKIRDDLDRIMLSRTNLDFLMKTFPKRNWLQLEFYLDKTMNTCD